jgi:cell division protein FtsQ
MKKKRSILDKQVVKKKDKKRTAGCWEGVRLATSLSFKLIMLSIVIVSISLFFIFLYQYLVTSPYFKLSRVVINGVDERLRLEIIEAAGLDKEQNLLGLNLIEIKKKVEENPWIRGVDIEKKYPHTLLLDVEKEMPCALVALDRMYYMNGSGRIFKEVVGNDNKDFPIITGISRDMENMNQRLILASNILESFTSETGPWSHDEISELHITDEGSVDIYSVSVPVVIRLNGKELGLKKEELVKIVEYLKRTGKQYLAKEIYLDYPGGAVVSFRRG